MRIIDISAPLDGGGPSWPGSRGYELQSESHVDRGDVVINSTVVMDVHAGTHVDAPAHHLAGGTTVEGLSLEAMIGAATVVEVGDDISEIDAAVVRAALGDVVPERVLFKTRGSAAWAADERSFEPSFVALTFEAAAHLARGGVRLVGIDGASIQRFGDPNDTHQVLFHAGAIVLEGLDLRAARAGTYQMVCLPILLVGAEAAPARVILIDSEEN